ncbi:MAG: GrrA/OscA1 family cyclophane-containing rSAM-modified RiPP [Steroidobacteraceae bacterium]|jgi:rSAM-associated Gly-rich repeat protein
MSTQNRISKALAALLPGGALGASILLALTSQSVTEARCSQTTDPPPAANVSERLLAIRSAVSNMEASSQSSGSAEFESGDSGRAEPTWWGNGRWGRWRLGWGNGGFGWPNWHNWHNWGNGGWGNGGWNNGGWHNYWHNY